MWVSIIIYIFNANVWGTYDVRCVQKEKKNTRRNDKEIAKFHNTRGWLARLLCTILFVISLAVIALYSIMASAASPKTVELGFLEECEPWLLTNTFFPSKIGGKPAWLELENIPTLDLLKCRKCQEILVFLCQVRSPANRLSNKQYNISFKLFFCRFMPPKRKLIAFTVLFLFSSARIHRVGSEIVQS